MPVFCLNTYKSQCTWRFVRTREVDTPSSFRKGQEVSPQVPPVFPFNYVIGAIVIPLDDALYFCRCQCSTLDGCHFNSLCFHHHHTLGWHSYMYRSGNLVVSKSFHCYLSLLPLRLVNILMLISLKTGPRFEI